MECEFLGHKCRQKAETKRVYYLQTQAEKKTGKVKLWDQQNKHRETCNGQHTQRKIGILKQQGPDIETRSSLNNEQK